MKSLELMPFVERRCRRVGRRRRHQSTIPKGILLVSLFLTTSSRCPAQGGPPTISQSGQPQSRTNEAGSNATFTVAPKSTVTVYYQWLFKDQNLPNATSSSYTIFNAQLKDQGNYRVRVENIYGSVLSDPATLTVYVKPTITVQPTNQSAVVGGSATFSVVASGYPSLNYQWRFNDRNIIWATNSDYTINSVQATNGGTYSVLVTNHYGSATSTVVILEVSLPVPPSITDQPKNVVTNVGASVTFSVAAAGAPPLSYQWCLDGISLTDSGQFSGTATTTLTITNVQIANEGSYSVVVSNQASSVTSSNASLQVDTNTTVRLINAAYATGSPGFRITGPVGTYVLQASSNLVNWDPVASNSTPALWWDYTDTGAAAFRYRFYRALLQ